MTNTNKLVRQYEYATGLKTGSTGEAKFCVSATAKKNGIDLIAVIMAAEDSKSRFKDAVNLLNYGFGKCQLYEDTEPEKLKNLPVDGGVKDTVALEYKDTFTYLDTTGADLSQMTKKTELKQSVKAPVKKGAKVGTVHYFLGEKEVGNVEILTKGAVEKAGFLDYLKESFLYFIRKNDRINKIIGDDFTEYSGV